MVAVQPSRNECLVLKECVDVERCVGVLKLLSLAKR